MEFNRMVGERLIQVSCKFEMLIYEITIAIKNYVQFVFLFVQYIE